MNDFVDSFAYWLADYHLATTVLLAAALVSLAVMRQPAKRLAVVKAAQLANVLLILLCVMPGWSLIHVAMSWPESQRAPVDVRTTNVAPLPIVSMDALTSKRPMPTEVVPMAAADVVPGKSLSWLQTGLAAYALGSVATLLWLAVGMVFARRLLAAATPANAEIEDILTAVVSEASVRPRLRVSEQIDVAAALGVWRPTVLLPSAWATARSGADLRTILAHECAHLRNGDLKWLALGRVLNVVLWLQPLYWLVRRRMRLDQESLADAAAAELSDRATYAEQLVAWARAVPQRPRPALASAVGLWESPSQLRWRVALLLDEHFPVLRECSRRLRWASLLLCWLLAVALSAITFQPANSDAAVDKDVASNADLNEPSSKTSDSEETEHSVVGGGTVSTFVAGNPATPWDYKPNVLALAVEDEAGKPLEGVEATVYRVSPRPGERSVVETATTDGRGAVEFAGLVESKRAAELRSMVAKSQFPTTQGDVFYTVLRRPGLATVILAASDFTLAGRGVKRSVRMRPAAELTGRVTDTQGKPVAGATVAAGGIAGFFALDGVNAVKTDTDGRFRFVDRVAFDRVAANKRIAEQNQWALAANRDMSKIYPAVYDAAEDTTVSDLVVMHSNYAVTTVRGGDVPDETNVVMRPAAAISGRVVKFPGGEPAAGVLIRAVGAPIPIDPGVISHRGVDGFQLFANDLHSAATSTDADGRYRLANLPAGKYDVWAVSPVSAGGASAWLSRGATGILAQAGEQAAAAPDLVIGPGATIRGRLVDATTGKPLPVGEDGPLLRATTFFDPLSQQQVSVQKVPVAADGEFNMQIVPGRARVYLIVNLHGDGTDSQGDYRTSDDAIQFGPLFDLRHGDSIEAEFKVWPRARIEENRAIISRGYERLRVQKLDEAINAFTSLIVVDPNNVSALTGRAQALKSSGRLAESMADFEALVRLNPMDTYAKSQLVEFLSSSPDANVRDGRRAVELGTQVLDEMRRNPPNEFSICIATMQLAAAQAEAGDFEAAVATQREAVETASASSRDGQLDRLKLYEAGKPYRRQATE